MKVVETWHNTWEISIAAGGLVTLACKCQTHFFRKTKKRSGPARAGTLSSATLTYTFSHFLFNFCVNWVLSALKGGVGVFLSSMREDHEKKILFVVLAVDNKCQIISVSKMSCRQGKGWSTDNLPCVNVFLKSFFSHSVTVAFYFILRSSEASAEFDSSISQQGEGCSTSLALNMCCFDSMSQRAVLVKQV